MRFRPKLIYLVDTAGGYSHRGKEGFISGQTAWTIAHICFQCHKDTKDHADTLAPSLRAKVIKLHLCAFEEPIMKSAKPC
jgi:hypothetical protein